MMLQQQNTLQQRNEQIERELDEIEKELQEIKEKNAEKEKNVEKEKPIYKLDDKPKVVIPTEVENKLQQLYYYDGFTLGRDALWQVIKQKMPEVHKKRPIRRAMVEKWLDGQEVEQIFKEPVFQKEYRLSTQRNHYTT